MPSSPNQNRYPQNPPQRKAVRQPNLLNAIAIVLAALILGICIIIAASGVSGSVKKLTAAVESKEFSSQFNSPSKLTVNSGAPQQYFSESDAAAYLNMSVSDIMDAIDSGEIQEYVHTDSGYTFSKTTLDEYFEQKAYSTRVGDGD